MFLDLDSLNGVSIFACVIIVLLILKSIVDAFRGNKTAFDHIGEHFGRAFDYLCDETKGDVVQKLNAFMGFGLLAGTLGFLFSVIVCLLMGSESLGNCMVAFFACLAGLIVSVPVCEKYTRHRY